MEFMDRRNRSLLVQFWLTVETFKNPLESVESGSDDDEDETIQDASTSITVKEDISMINDLYFSGSAPHPVLSSIPKKYVDSIREFARSELTSSPAAQRRVRRSVLLAQRQVERDMEQDFEDFGSSGLWFRVINDAEFMGRKVPEIKDRRFSAVQSSSSFPSAKRTAPFPRSESTPKLSMKRTSSSGSERSVKSTPPNPIHTSRAPPSNIEVLMSPVTDSSSNSTRAPLFDDPDDKAQRIEEQRMEEIHAALTDIVALEHPPHNQSSVNQGIGERVSMFLSPRRRSTSGDTDEAETTLQEDLHDEEESEETR